MGGGGGALPSACQFETFPRVLLTLVALGASISNASPHSARTASLSLMAVSSSWRPVWEAPGGLTQRERKRSESGTGRTVETLERFRQNQRVIEDFTVHTLSAIPSGMGRLLHVATLRDLSSGRYCHEGLLGIYSEPAVHQALSFCHEELFAKVLETPLAQQIGDLRGALEGTGILPGARSAGHAGLPEGALLLESAGAARASGAGAR
jgi:hypothetical protein